MRFSTRILCLLGILSVLIAGPVTIDKATAVSSHKYPHKTIEGCEKLSNGLYLTTFKNGGFVLTSSDDAFPAILGYSDSAPADKNNPAFLAMCDQYSREIETYAPLLNNMHPDWNMSEPGALNKVAADVQPLLTSKWNQSPYYNDQFPYFKLPGYTTIKPYVGCVAVVMGQLLNYYEHPRRGFGKRWYFSATTDSTLSAEFDTTWYDYENMPDSLCNEYGVQTAPADQIEDVSLLLYQCAVSVEMDFQTGGSSAAYEDMTYALTSYFDYGPDMMQEESKDFGDNDWKQMIVAELNEGRPVPYRGSNEEGSSGHAFILDGYETTTTTYFHVNWGWGGYYDGWFLLTALNPAEGHDYRYFHAAVFDIHPNTDDLTRYAYTGFEGYQAGWSYDGSGITSDLIMSGNYSCFFSANHQWLISPKIHIPNNDNATLMFYAQKLNTGTKECRVMLSFTDTLRESFTTEIGRITPGTSWELSTFSLRPYKNSVAHLGFEYLSTTGGYIVLDELSIWTPKVVISTQETVPETHELLTAYPNPFNPSTTIRFQLSEPGNVELNVYDLHGRQLQTLVNGMYEKGQYSVNWHAGDIPSGIYICTLSIDNSLVETHKMCLVK